MKIWLHFSKLLTPYQTKFNPMEVADVQLSNTTAPIYFYLIRMSEFQREINEIKQK